MAKTDLKTFNIETYDIELDYNRQIAPIQKKIDRLDNNHESKSLKAHKDFLAKEKASTLKLAELESKLEQKYQRIEKAVENKLIKTSKKEAQIKREFSQYKEAQNEALKSETSIIDEKTDELKTQEETDLQVVKDKYKKNVESYVEKLDTYNSNFENNKVIFTEQYAKYSKILQDSLTLIEKIRQEHESSTTSLLDEFISTKQQENTTTEKDLQEGIKDFSNYALDIRKQSNIASTNDRKYISSLKKRIEDNYMHMIDEAKTLLRTLEMNFQKRQKDIKKDLEINLGKVDTLLENLGDKPKRREKRDLLKRKDLFTKRASTTLYVEEQLFNEYKKILNDEIEFVQKNLHAELINFDKLYEFLLSDHEQLKESGEFFKKLNIELMEQLSLSEIKNNDYLIAHEKLTIDFINDYNKEFNRLKKRLIESNIAQIDQLTTINAELDDINKFLDTVEPLKEIELNHLRESIECNEIEERYNIKFAKQDHERKLLKNNSIKDISLEEINMKNELRENDQAITEIKAKETMDKAIEQAKLKFQKAEEIKKLRLNSTKLERNLLKSSYDTEIEKAELRKDLTVLEVRKENAIRSKSIDKEIDNIEIEAKYKQEVVTKQNEEEILKLKEQITKLENERDSFENSVLLMINKEEQITDEQTQEVNKQADEKLLLIDEALERECKEPLLNIAKSEVIIKERLLKFDTSYDQLIEYLAIIKENTLNPTSKIDSRKSSIIKNKDLPDKTKQYIDSIYSYGIDALNYMHQINEKRLQVSISTSSDEHFIKRTKKQIEKIQTDLKRAIQSLNQSKKEQSQRILSLLKNNLQQLNKLKGLEEEGFVKQINSIFTSHLKQLNTLSTSLQKEVKDIYLPLTEQDQQVVDHANKHAVKAKQQIERQRELEIAPISQQYGAFIKDKEAEKERVVYGYTKQIETLKDTIKGIEAKSQEQVNEVNAKQYEAIEQKKLELKLIKENEDAEIARRIELLNEYRQNLEQQYNETLLKLEQKDLEAEKIYEYEERIYKIALETAESRFNETVSKASKVHERTRDEQLQSIQTVKDIAERNIERINRELLDLTSKHEKNIFTVRPRFEESIGDAQRAIEDEAKIKIARRAELLEQNTLRTSSIEESLERTFSETITLLEENLQNYKSTYQDIEQEYKQSIDLANNQINNGHNQFMDSLYNLGKTKIEKIQKRMSELNKKLS